MVLQNEQLVQQFTTAQFEALDYLQHHRTLKMPNTALVAEIVNQHHTNINVLLIKKLNSVDQAPFVLMLESSVIRLFDAQQPFMVLCAINLSDFLWGIKDHSLLNNLQQQLNQLIHTQLTNNADNDQTNPEYQLIQVNQVLHWLTTGQNARQTTHQLWGDLRRIARDDSDSTMPDVTLSLLFKPTDGLNAKLFADNVISSASDSSLIEWIFQSAASEIKFPVFTLPLSQRQQKINKTELLAHHFNNDIHIHLLMGVLAEVLGMLNQ